MDCFPVLILCAVFIIKGATANLTITCSVSVSDVPEGQPVAIICQFSEDLGTHTNNFYVERQTGSSLGSSVVSCTWNNTSKLYGCTSTAGYIIDETNITKTVRVLIPRVVKAQEGNYSCQITTASNITSCELKVKDSPFVTSCHVGRVLEGKPANITFFFNKDLKLAKASFIIIQQPLSADKPDKPVLNCFKWKYETYECNTDDDYELRNNPTTLTTLTLHVKSASKSHQGSYTALVQSKLLGSDTPCIFMLAENEFDPPTCSTPETSTSSHTSTEPSTTDGSCANSTVKNQTVPLLIAILVLVVVVHVIVLLGLAVLAWKKWPRPARKKTHEETFSETSLKVLQETTPLNVADANGQSAEEEVAKRHDID